MSTAFKSLHELARDGNDDELFNLLENYKVSVYAKDDLGMTPLHWACFNNKIGSVMILLDHEANINAKDNSLRTPLHCAMQENHEELSNLLISNGADEFSEDIVGIIPRKLREKFILERSRKENI